jgi:hypothetical protein
MLLIREGVKIACGVWRGLDFLSTSLNPPLRIRQKLNAQMGRQSFPANAAQDFPLKNMGFSAPQGVIPVITGM